MTTSDRIERVRAMYRAYETRDRDLIESLIADEFAFSAPPDPLLDRAGYFERCWPNAQHITAYEIVRAIEHGDEVVITYEATRDEGPKFRNTEIFTVAGERISRVEVYFGWDLE
jgi:ketosteroid isomerase-like protein